MKRMADIAILGMGAAGCMAGIACASAGKRVALFDRNEKVGKKIYITGKGRCNVTNAAPFPGFFDGIARNPRFLHSAFASMNNLDLMNFFAKHGQPLKVERGERVFPTSDHASDINRVLETVLRENGATLYFHHCVKQITYDGKTNRFALFFTDQEPFFASRLILACGGKSYPSTGSTGDGYRFAEAFGHTIVPLSPALVPLCLQDDFVAYWEGISLKNIALTAKWGKKKKTLFGEMLFTHDGISGPVVLTLSSFLSGSAQNDVSLFLDWKPALDEDALRHRLVRERQSGANRSLKTLFSSFLPKRCVDVFLQKGKWNEDCPFHSWTKAEEERFIGLLKAFPLSYAGLGSFSQAVITRGGVAVKEVWPKTMASRKQKGLFLAGEMLDVDGFTGGYNLQIAFSTGYAAGLGAAASLDEECREEEET